MQQKKPGAKGGRPSGVESPELVDEFAVSQEVEDAIVVELQAQGGCAMGVYVVHLGWALGRGGLLLECLPMAIPGPLPSNDFDLPVILRRPTLISDPASVTPLPSGPASLHTYL